MSVSIRNNRDVYAGALFIAIGGTAFFLARDYRFGSGTAMGPGYFPTVLSLILVVLGLIVVARGLNTNEKISVHWSKRAVVALTAAILLFAVLMPVAGFVPALATLIFVSSVGGKEFKVREAVPLTIAVTALLTALIIGALGLPYPLFGRP